MKKIIIILAFNTLTLALFSSPEIYLMYSAFNSPSTPYIETYMSIIGKSLVYQNNQNNKLQAKLEVVIIAKKNDTIAFVDKYYLDSPEILDTLEIKPNFVDVQRIPLSNGIYHFQIQIKDVNTEEKPSTYDDIITINFNNDDLLFSDVELIEKYEKSTSISLISKSGYDLVPYVSNFFPTNMEKLSFYFEIYNSNKTVENDFLLKCYIENYHTKTILEQYGGFKKLKPSTIIPYIGEINIKDLPSGNYNLVLDVRNSENVILKQERFFFQRSNLNIASPSIEEIIESVDIHNVFIGDMSSRDSLIQYILSLRPISNSEEQMFIDNKLKASSLEILQNYFIMFWYSQNSKDPGKAWEKYNEQIQYVNRLYGTKIRKGFETDMGIIYLKYGAPNSIYTSSHEPSAYPYEIWTYWKMETETNRKFVFYNPTIVGKEYELLHSNAKGEIRTPSWERYLQKRNNILYDFDDINSDDSWGSRALEEFNK